MTRVLTLAAYAVAALLLYSSPVHSQDAPGAYDAKWQEAAAALVAFSNAALLEDQTRVDLAALAPIYRRERERFATALASVTRLTPPRARLMFHWQIVPAHERVLSAMTLVRDAAERRDAAAMTAAWATLRDQVGILRKTISGLNAAR